MTYDHCGLIPALNPFTSYISSLEIWITNPPHPSGVTKLAELQIDMLPTKIQSGTSEKENLRLQWE